MSEVPQLQLSDRVHGQNLCCAQVSHGMDSAAVCILCTISATQSIHVAMRHTLVVPAFQRERKPVFVQLTYDPRHSFLVGPEDHDPAVLADCDDLRAAAHQAGAGGVVAWEVMRSSPALGNRYRLRSK